MKFSQVNLEIYTSINHWSQVMTCTLVFHYNEGTFSLLDNTMSSQTKFHATLLRLYSSGVRRGCGFETQLTALNLALQESELTANQECFVD